MGERVERDTLIVVTGPGRDRAGAAAQALINQGVAGLVSWGCAAGLNADARAGDLYLPTRIVGAAGECLVDAVWHDALCARLANRIEVHLAPLCEATTVLRTVTQKSTLARSTGAAAADMESMAIAQVAARSDVPFLAVRAVADGYDTVIPDAALAVLDADGGRHPARVLPFLFRHPGLIIDLLRLGRDFRASCATLKAVHREAGSRLLLR